MIKLTILFFLTFIAIHSSSLASYPSTLWSSNRINDTIIGIKVGKIQTGKGVDIVTLTSHTLKGYQISDGNLIETFKEEGGLRDEWIKLSLFDLEGDGIEEIIVSGFYGHEIRSLIGRIENNKFLKIIELNYYLLSISFNNKRILVGQKRVGEDDFSGPLMEMKWKGDSPNGKMLVKEREIKLPGGMSGNTMSLFSVLGMPGNNFLYLYPSGTLSSFVSQDGKYKKQWSSGEEYGGSVYYLKKTIKNPLNQAKGERFFIPVSFVSDQFILKEPVIPLPQVSPCSEEVGNIDPLPVGGLAKHEGAEIIPCLPAKEAMAGFPIQTAPQSQSLREMKSSANVYLIKNVGYLKNVIGAIPSIKNAQLVKLVSTGFGFQEEWNSPRFDGAISDFDLIDWDGDGTPEIIAALLLRDKGYVDTLKKQDSLLIVVDIP